MEIGGLEKSTLIDYPAKVACTVFLVGCNFRCPFCYSSELVLPEKIKSQPRISEKEFFDFLKKRKGLLEGVVICGGEPTQNKDLPDFIKKIKKLGYRVKLDTNGSSPEILAKLIGEKLIDYVAMDIKAPKERYYKATGVKVDIKKIQKSIDILKRGKVDYELRSTILPKLHTKEDIVNMAKWIRNAKVYYLQQFRPEKTIDPEYEQYKPFSQEELKSIQKECSKYVFTKLRS
ncbi:MAG: anaerobic ribonucleoside-triphosphate reductase activating protein [Candidatus Nealsonbacteria bacterium CG_4_10_14_0_2_um_filter_40_15]|uniref:Anaerobic ribonucleoside-triphosphate reductase activating protein n=2 Tax=Candidatus Nealsoniibacteriota TaxID=1817911 RepID=A0A2M7D7A8_9BACT|nr:MAG: anaerobic ribonucleoside-triphosphate reductase activating protein [Candidatus Nealsonbacteria bacterium CG02_land_8_20_14_3_00_40_11]PIZ87835.1 MAG: anaerobic ribonucleoside-triphosphate reductase activating protein [Candidatus Nealsonbacteria bacterium CG_4_10_14_0_2_um_filter_40_15]